MRLVRRACAFTLIEVLVVVAIIALLVSILLPSLGRAKNQARAVVCQTNVRQLLTAFFIYSNETRGLFPATSEDPGADWLGGGNRGGRQPQDGVIYKHLGSQKNVYVCPSDDVRRPNNQTKYSYTASTLMSGANPALISGAHYQFSSSSPSNYSQTDHRTNMRPLRAMVIIEEAPEFYLVGVPNSAWDNDDGITQRHLNLYGSVGFVDGSVGRVSLPAKPHVAGKYFSNNSLCVRAKGKWISGLSWRDFTYDPQTNPRGAWRLIERAKPAINYGVRHTGDS